jgi:hypothetical protein
MSTHPLWLLRPAVASALCLFAAAVWAIEVVDEPLLFLYIPTALLVGAAGLVHLRSLGAQMLARGVMWALLLLGALLAQLEGPDGPGVGALIGGACAGALLFLGGRGLDAASPRFAPIAYRGTLTAALTLAMADTLSLVFWSLAAIDSNEVGVGVGLLGCAALMAIGIAGLYRLRTWGLAVNIAANLLIAGLVGSGALDTPSELTALLLTTAALQLLVPLPMLVGIVRRRPPALTAARSRAATVAAAAAILLVLALAVQPLFGQPLVGRYFP